MVYGWAPTLPGAPTGLHKTDQQGSDTEAMLIWEVPAGFIESRSLWEDGELPLWDRYGHAGSPFLGQAVTMLGDPLQLMVLLGRGSAIAWDLKFLAAKFLFCAGLGLLIRRLTGSHWLGLIYAVLGAYCGANFYIKNHPSFFVFTYAPWILLSALEFLDLSSGKYRRWGMFWLLVNFACFNAGHVEVAVDLIGGLNLAAMLQALCRGRGTADYIAVVLRLGTGTGLFLGLTAPVWLSFLVAEADAFSLHTQVQVVQIPAVSLPGMFDDFFYLLLRTADSVMAPAPGGNLLFLSGIILALVNWRRLKAEPLFWINNAAIVLLAAFIFAPVMVPILKVIPFLNRVGHTFADFSYLLVFHLAIQSAYGFACLATEKDFGRAVRQLAWMALMLEGGSVLYCSEFDLPAEDWAYLLLVMAGAVGAPWLFAFLKSRRQMPPLAGWVAIVILGFIPLFRFGLYHTGNHRWLMIPGPRVTLNNPSPALEKLKSEMTEPGRVAGLWKVLWGDYAAVYGLEDIRSCAPLSNEALMELMGNFPGISLPPKDWEMEVTDPVRAQPLLNLLNVRYILAWPSIKALPGVDFRVIDHSDMGVVENPEVWPRAFFTGQITSIASNQEFIQRLLQDGRHPFIALAPEEIEKQPGLARLETASPAPTIPATHYQLRVNSTAFDIHAPSAGVIGLTEGQARDFTARVNGEIRPVLTVNRAFKGIYLDHPGDYHVTFTYRPRYWTAACLIFWISLAGVLVIAAAGFRGRNQTGGGGRSEPKHFL